MIDVRSAIFFILIAESFLFAAQLLGYKSIKLAHNRVLGILMIAMGLFLTISLFRSPVYYYIAIYTNYILLPLFLSITPFYYLYVKSLTDPKYKFTKKIIVHFIPSLLILLSNIIYYSLLPENLQIGLITHSIKNLSIEGESNIVLKINLLIETFAIFVYYIQLVFYVIMMILMLRKHQRNIKYYFSFEKNISLKWIKAFVVIIILNSLLEIFMAFFSIYIPNMSPEIVYVYYFFLFLLITTLGYFGVKQNEIYNFNDRQVFSKTSDSFIPNIPNEDINLNELDIHEKPDENLEILPLHYMISDDEQKRIVDAVIKLINEEKIHQNNKLSVFELAELLGTNKTYISVSINNVLKKNFRQFINEYRIEEAKKILLDSNFDHYSIDGIAQLVGFSSKSTFNQAFKKFTDLTPTEFKREQSLIEKDNS